MSAVGWRGLAMLGGFVVGTALATGAYYSTRYLIEWWARR